MSTLVVETIKHTNDTTLFASDTSGQLTVQGESTATTNLQQGLAKSWITYGDTASAGNPAIFDSFNISGITDNGTGDTTYAYSSNMAVAKGYTVSGTFAHSSDITIYVYSPQPKQHNSVATDTLRITQNYAGSGGSSLSDYDYVSNSMTGDLA
tara:strand:+ start:41 stop:499 length:459 start_codon:yes stop_codon:yes gene_type:complete